MKLSVRGYTLIELLVVISIISLLAVFSFANFKSLGVSQVTVKAVGQVQTLLRLAESNATSGVTCSGSGGINWNVRFCADKVDLICNEPVGDFLKPCSQNPATYQISYPIDKAAISVKCSSGAANLSLPVTVSYSGLSGQVSFRSSNAADACINTTSSLFITATNSQNSTVINSFTISKGGAIDVQ